MEKMLSNIEYNYKTIVENISNTAIKSGRNPEDIKFLAATKTVEPLFINHAISLGLKYIGENRVQELLSKYEHYDLENADLQFIGHLQTNKVRQLISKVSTIQSVDSLKLAKEISRLSSLAGINTNILIEVNVGREENKSGVMPEELEELLYEIALLPSISVDGLMAIPPICENQQKIRGYFEIMRNMFIDISRKNIDNITMNTLSMGMSGDYQEAILEGATLVRIGSSLFGERIYK